MIQRIVLIKLRDEYTKPAALCEVADHSRQEIAKVPGVLDVSVGTFADASTGSDWDLALVVRFDRIEDVPVYGSHPVHRAYVDEYLKPRMEFIKAWNFAVVDERGGGA